MTKNEQNSLSLRLEQCYTGVLHDVMRVCGMSRFTLPPELRPILKEKNNGWTSLYHLGKTMARDGSSLDSGSLDKTVVKGSCWTYLDQSTQ